MEAPQVLNWWRETVELVLTSEHTNNKPKKT